MNTRVLLAALLAGAVLVQPLVALADAQATASEQGVEERVVYHVNDSANATAALRNIANHLNAAPDAKIVVVTHSKGIDFLLNDAVDDKGDSYQAKIAALKERGVDFRVCRNTLKGRKLDDSAVIFEASVVPSGVAEIGRLQAREGFVYLKP
jgi:intracellular sulfur oxidation DsrE/DsrF family protein